MHDVTAHDAHALRKTYAACEIGGSWRPVRIEFDTGHDGAVLVSEITCRAGQPCAKIGDLTAGPDVSAFRQGIDHGKAAIVILIERKQILRRKGIEMPSPGLCAGKNLFPRNGMAAVKRQDMILVFHFGCQAPRTGLSLHGDTL